MKENSDNDEREIPVVFVKTKGGETLLGRLAYFSEGDDDEAEPEEIQIVDVVKLVTSFSTDPNSGLAVPYNIPALYSPFSDGNFVNLSSSDYFVWDICSDYYATYYETVFTELSRFEADKQRIVLEQIKAFAEAAGEGLIVREVDEETLSEIEESDRIGIPTADKRTLH